MTKKKIMSMPEFFITEDHEQIKKYIIENKIIRDKGVPESYLDEILQIFTPGISKNDLCNKLKDFLSQEDNVSRR